MASNYVWIFAFLAFAFLVQSGESLRCWSCVSDQPGACGDPLNITNHHQTFHTRDCDSNANPNSYIYNEKFVCKKIVQKENGRLVVRRSCEIPGPEERDIKDGPCVAHDTTHSHVTMVSCHICSTDLCNSATSLSGSKVFLISAVAFIGSRFVPALKSFSF